MIEYTGEMYMVAIRGGNKKEVSAYMTGKKIKRHYLHGDKKKFLLKKDFYHLNIC